MLTIRKEQMQAFRQAALQNFEDEMVAHLKEFTPHHAASLGEAGLRNVIRFGMGRAGRYGFTCRGPLRFYIELVFSLGSEFDTDPQYPWAAVVLTDPGIDYEMERADRLFDQYTEYRDAVAGPDRVYAKAALRALKNEPYAGFPVSDPRFTDRVLERLRRGYPQKCDVVGEAPLRALIGEAVATARQQGITSDPGISLIVALMFILGHGVTTDPHYPWVGDTLRNPDFGDPNQRAERLYSKSMTYLSRALAHIGEG
jgi:hypothetical protein